MKAKDFLKQVRKYEMLIRNKKAEKAQWQAIATGTTARMDGERVQTSGSQQKMADAIDRYVDMEAEIDRVIDYLIDARNDVIRVIEQLPADEYDVLHKIYVQAFNLYEVAFMNEKSYSWATTIHGRALQKVQKILDADDKRKAETGK